MTDTPEATKAAPLTRDYFVVKRVAAGNLDPDTLVWVEVPSSPSDDPLKAILAAAANEDMGGKFVEGLEYRASGRWKSHTPKKKTEPQWT